MSELSELKTALMFFKSNVMLYANRSLTQKKYHHLKDRFTKADSDLFFDDSELLHIVLEVFITMNYFKSISELDDFMRTHLLFKKFIFSNSRDYFRSLYNSIRPQAKFTPQNVLQEIERRIAREELDIEQMRSEAISDILTETQELQRNELAKKKALEEETKELLNTKKELELEIKEFSFEVDPTELNRELDIFSETDNTQTQGLWYEEINLRCDPFPGENKGLVYAINNYFYAEKNALPDKRDNLFYDILVFNPIFNEFQKIIHDYPQDFLNKTYIIAGGFGSGKSVLFEFIEKESLKNNISVINVWIDGNSDVNTIIQRLYLNILRSTDLKRLYSEATSENIRSTLEQYDSTEIRDSLETIKAVLHKKGFVFIIDGLHKLTEHANVAVEFLKSLQNLSDDLNHSGIDSSFVIAGLPSWLQIIKKSDSITGSLNLQNNFRELPEVDSSFAYKMINQRLKYFANDENNIPHIPVENIKKIEIILKQRLSTLLTSRDYINEIMPSLKHSELSTLYLNPLFTRDNIRDINDLLLTSHEALHSDLLRLKNYFSRNILNSLKLVKILLGVGNFIDKEDAFCLQNKSSIALLLKFNLLFSCKNKDSIGFKYHKNLKRFDKDIKSQFGYQIKEVFYDLFKQKILNYEMTDTMNAFENDAGIDVLSSIISQESVVKTKILSLCEDVQLNHLSLLQQKDLEPQFIEDVKLIVKNLLSCIFIVINVNYTVDSFEEYNKLFLSQQFNWLRGKSETYDLFHNKLYHLGNFNYENKELYELLADYKNTFIYLANLLRKLIRYDDRISLNAELMTVNDLRYFHKIRSKFGVKNVDSAASLHEYFEEKMRSFLYCILKIKFGDKYRRQLGSIVNAYIKDQKERSTKTHFQIFENDNVLFDCDRVHYSLIILDRFKNQNNGTQNWSQIFSKIFPHGRERIQLYFDDIHPFIVKKSHNAHDNFYKKNIEQFRKAIINFSEICEFLNQGLLKVLHEDNIIKEKISPEKDVLYFTFDLNKEKFNLKPYIISSEKLKPIIAKINRELKNERTCFFLDLIDYEYIEQRFNCKYRDFIATLALGIIDKRINLTFEENSFKISLIGN